VSYEGKSELYKQFEQSLGKSKKKVTYYRPLLLAGFGLLALVFYGGDNKPSTAQTETMASRATDFNAPSIREIVEASRTNEPRFNRDYKGKVFTAALPFKSVNEGLLSSSRYKVELDGAYCFTSSAMVAARKMADWNRGRSV
jgi:hypothetical protein